MLASADELPDIDLEKKTALTYGPKNMATSEYGTVVADDGIETGNWDFRAPDLPPAPPPSLTNH